MVSWLAGVAYWRGLTALRPAATLGDLLFRRRDAAEGPRAASGRAARAGAHVRALAGGVAHFLLGTLAFPALYALAFHFAGHAEALLGAGLGAVHGLLAGLALPLAWRAAGRDRRAGAFGWRLGAATPVALLAGHVLYGTLLGYIYVTP